MTRDHQRQRIAGAGGPDGPYRFGAADGCGDGGVVLPMAIGDVAEVFDDGAARFAEKVVILDSRLIDTLLAIPL